MNVNDGGKQGMYITTNEFCCGHASCSCFMTWRLIVHHCNGNGSRFERILWTRNFQKNHGKIKNLIIICGAMWSKSNFKTIKLARSLRSAIWQTLVWAQEVNIDRVKMKYVSSPSFQFIVGAFVCLPTLLHCVVVLHDTHTFMRYDLSIICTDSITLSTVNYCESHIQRLIRFIEFDHRIFSQSLGISISVQQ